MKIKIISDLHLDKSRLSQGDADLVIIAGDMFEPMNENFENNMMEYSINKLDNVIVLRGNHDTWAVEKECISADFFDGHIYENGNICVAHGLYIDKETQKRFTNPEKVMEWASPCLLHAAWESGDWGAGKPSHFWGLSQLDVDELRAVWGSEKAYREFYKDKTIYLGHFHTKGCVKRKSPNFRNLGNIKYLYQKDIELEVDKDGQVW